MKINSDFKDLLLLFSDKQVEYLLVGGVAVILHSEPRYTKDLDLWVNTTVENAKKVYSALLEFGAPLEQLGVFESDFQTEGQVVQFGVAPVRIDIIMSIKGLIFSEAWKNRVVMDLGDLAVNVISRSDLIDAKLEAGRPQDLLDAKALKSSKKGKGPG